MQIKGYPATIGFCDWRVLPAEYLTQNVGENLLRITGLVVSILIWRRFQMDGDLYLSAKI